MENYYVYFEHVLILNLVLNCLILWMTAKVLTISISKKRLMMGGMVGAAYSFLLLLPDAGQFVNLFTKFLVSVVMICIAFWPLTARRLIQGVISLYLVTFLLGGTIFGLSFFLQDSGLIPYFEVLTLLTKNMFYITVAVAIIYLIFGRWIYNFVNKNLIQGLFKTSVTISFEGKDTEVMAMVDTGNHLRDPILNHPVIIVEYEAIQAIIPEEVRAVFQTEYNLIDNIADILTVSPIATKFRIIPFKSLGKDNGLLLGFKPEKILIRKGKNIVQASKVIVGIYNQKLSPEGSYKALLHPEVLYSSC